MHRPKLGRRTRSARAGFLISALGGSNVQIGGPAGAFIVIVFGIVERYGLPADFFSQIGMLWLHIGGINPWALAIGLVALVLANVNEQPLSLMRRSGFADAIGEESIVPTVAAAFDDQPSR